VGTPCTALTRVTSHGKVSVRMSDVDTFMWAIKHVPTGNLVGNKWQRMLWKTKPTNALNSILWKYNKHTGKDADLVSIRVHITEVQEDE
jgi:hypothetical protein